MVNESAANTTALKNFDVSEFILGFRAPEFRVPLFRRADLVPEIEELERQIDEAQKAAAEQTKKSRSFAEKPNSDLDALIDRYNSAVQEFEESKVDFLFRPFTSGELKEWVAKTKELTESDETDLPIYASGLALTCVSHPLTEDQFMLLCDQVGAFAFGAFGRAWNRTLSTGGAPDAPFSRKSSHTPTTRTRSKA